MFVDSKGESIEGTTVQKIIEPVLIGMHNGNVIHLCYGKYGYYLKYNGKNYSIPDWAKQDNLNEVFNLYHAVKIIDYKDYKEKQKQQLAVKIPNKD